MGNGIGWCLASLRLHLDACIIPTKYQSAIRHMISLKDQAGVTSTNKYFRWSDGYPQGSHKISNVVNSISGFVAPSLLTATKFRHMANISFKSMTATEDERTLMFAHLGHSEKVNQNVYQHPQAISEVIHVAKFLQQFDGKNRVPICLWSSI